MPYTVDCDGNGTECVRVIIAVDDRKVYSRAQGSLLWKLEIQRLTVEVTCLCVAEAARWLSLAVPFPS